MGIPNRQLLLVEFINQEGDQQQTCSSTSHAQDAIGQVHQIACKQYNIPGLVFAEGNELEDAPDDDDDGSDYAPSDDDSDEDPYSEEEEEDESDIDY